jgi:hypothetical protein
MPHLSDIDKARVVSHLKNGSVSVRRKAGSSRPKASNERQDEELLNFLRERLMSNAVEAIHQTKLSAKAKYDKQKQPQTELPAKAPMGEPDPRPTTRISNHR